MQGPGFEQENFELGRSAQASVDMKAVAELAVAHRRPYLVLVPGNHLPDHHGDQAFASDLRQFLSYSDRCRFGLPIYAFVICLLNKL